MDKSLNSKTMPESLVANVSGSALSLLPETQYRIFIDKMKYNIIDAVDGCFDADTEPEICFEVFRGALRRFKKENKEAYLKYLESDEETPIEESEISKWRRSQADR